MSYNRTALFASLESHLRRNPSASLSETARYLHIERHTVERIVREHARCAFRDYQRLARRECAQELLASANSVQQIAATLGYSSGTAFSRFFRKETGLTPSVYRRRMEARPSSQAAGAGYAEPMVRGASSDGIA